MSKNSESPLLCDDAFKSAALEFLETTGGDVEGAAAELGISADDLSNWSQAASLVPKPSLRMTGMAKLKAENEALRNEVRQLHSQWESLRTTLGVLSTSGGADFAT